MKYFSHLYTVAEIKKEYKRLVWLHHPDRGGDTATMQEINAQYLDALQRADRQTSTDEKGKEHTYYYNEDREQAIIDKIDELIRANVPSAAGVDVYLIGTWIWIVGETKPIKETLKELGCRWHNKRKCWYWQNGKRGRYNKRADLAGLAATYGATKIRQRAQRDDDRPRQLAA